MSLVSPAVYHVTWTIDFFQPFSLKMEANSPTSEWLTSTTDNSEPRYHGDVTVQNTVWKKDAK